MFDVELNFADKLIQGDRPRSAFHRHPITQAILDAANAGAVCFASELQKETGKQIFPFGLLITRQSDPSVITERIGIEKNRQFRTISLGNGIGELEPTNHKNAQAEYDGLVLFPFDNGEIQTSRRISDLSGVLFISYWVSQTSNTPQPNFQVVPNFELVFDKPSAAKLDLAKSAANLSGINALLFQRFALSRTFKGGLPQ